jgi:hypothetical protein
MEIFLYEFEDDGVDNTILSKEAYHNQDDAFGPSLGNH